MKKLFVGILLVAALGCQKEKIDAGCIEQPHNGRGCAFILNPVCGCNGKTYGNPCMAEAVGITRYTKGECKSGK